MRQVKGSDLPKELQARCLARFVHRFTKEHKPQWVTKPRGCGGFYPVQFASDAEWLANTVFQITEKGELSEKHIYCSSKPTWPDNPELRK